MNKYQLTILITGFILMVLTWVYGNSQFQAYESDFGFGSLNGGTRAVIKQRVKKEILVLTIILEGIGTIALVYLLKDFKKTKCVVDSGSIH